MTPEERGREIAYSDRLFDEVPDPDDYGYYKVVNFERLESDIAAAIREAVAAERDAIVAIVANKANGRREMLTAIRARGEQP